MMQGMFVVVGVIGAVLLVSTFVFDDVIDELVPGADFISGPVVGAFLAAFGLFGWFLDDGVDSPTVVAVAAALGGGAVFGGVTYRVTKALIDQPTDATPTAASLVGTSGRVVTPIRAGGIGEVLVTLGGAASKFTATADADLPAGSTVVVVAVESPTKVRVESESAFWS
jgi:membrane protein implicated in regulation of membrane protease activity